MTGDIRLAAETPPPDTINRIVEHALQRETPDCIAAMAARWGYLHGQWDARASLLGVESPVVWAPCAEPCSPTPITGDQT